MSGLQGLLVAGGLIAGLLLLVYGLRKVQDKSRAQGQLEGTIKTADEYNKAQNAENEQIAKQNEELVEKMEEANETRDRIDSDPEYRDRVRDRFTRD